MKMKNLKIFFAVILVTLTASIAFGDATDELIDAIFDEKATVGQIQTLIQNGANVNAFFMAGYGEKQRVSVLMSAIAETQNVDIIKVLLRTGARVNAKSSYGITALMFAAGNTPNAAEIVKILLEKGARVNDRDSSGSTALIYAAYEQKDAEVIKILLNAGAKVNYRDEAGKTALMGAVYNFYRYGAESREEFVKLLINAGADVNATDNEGMTALMIAAKHYECEEAVRLLINAGANVYAKDKDGKTALDYAYNEEIKQILRNAMK